VNSFDIVKWLISNNNLEDCMFHLYAHKARKNWRQINDTLSKKISNLDTGIEFDKYNLINVSGKRVLNLNNLNDYITNINPLISFVSKFSKNDTIFHIPMMNLHTCKEISQDKLISTLNSIIRKRFWLLKTDRYYHIYSNDILNNDDWIKWNLRFLMTDFLVSPRYIGHSLDRKFNLLRQNTTTIIKMKIPSVIYDSNSKEK